jgi:hypothetical protein
MNSNQYIFYFEYKSKETIENSTIVDNTVYKDIETVLKKAIQIGRAFDPSGTTYTPDGIRSLVYSSRLIDVYVLMLKQYI